MLCEMYTIIKITNTNAWIAPIKILKPCHTINSGIAAIAPNTLNVVSFRIVAISTSPAKIFANRRIPCVNSLDAVSIKLIGKNKANGLR
ncbi:hypothetical protein D3C74_396960 [compost metagenome]